MLKKILFLSVFCIFSVTPLCAQVATMGLYNNRRQVPTPRDPNTCQRPMQLSAVDADLQKKADEYLKQGKSELAIEELKKISDPWVYHWYLSFIYEAGFELKQALKEIRWLISRDNCKKMAGDLEFREEAVEKAIKDMKDWQEHQDQLKPPEKEDLLRPLPDKKMLEFG